MCAPGKAGTRFSRDMDGWTSVDWKGAGWYRITGGAGTKLADFVVAIQRCGTDASGWMSGGHPTVFSRRGDPHYQLQLGKQGKVEK